MGLSWLEHCTIKQEDTVQFLVRTCAWVAGLVPSWGTYESKQIDVSLLSFPSLKS